MLFENRDSMECDVRDVGLEVYHSGYPPQQVVTEETYPQWVVNQ